MRNFKHFLLAFVLFSTVVFAQENRIYQLIEESKNENKNQIESDHFLTRNSEKSLEEFSDKFQSNENVVLLNFNKKNLHLDEFISLHIPNNDGGFILDLLEFTSSFNDYVIVTDKGKYYDSKKSKLRHYKGVIRGQKNSMVALSISDDEISGIISHPKKGDYNLGKLGRSKTLILYNEKDLALKERSFTCEVDESESLSRPNINGEKSGNKSLSDCIQIYYEIDYETYQDAGSNVLNVNDLVIKLFLQNALVYFNENINIVLSEIFVWTSSDPYATNSSVTTLTNFRNTRTTFNGDLAQLITRRTSSGSGIAYVDQLCGVAPYSVANMPLAFANYPIYSRQIKVSTHELGHNFGSSHTHSCVWNGNNTEIDNYGNINGNTNAVVSTSSCFNGTNPILNVTPTIMSYYDSYGHGTFPLSNGFGTQPGNLIRNNIQNDNCMSSCPGYDLYIKDENIDTGIEPNPSNNPMWQSPDIWVRQSMDGGLVHQNPDYQINNPNGLYVRVTNRGNRASKISKLRVYWAKASSGLQWPSDFNNHYIGTVLHGDEIGEVDIPSIPPGMSTIVEMPWFPPNPADYSTSIHHFCLTARILSAEDPMFNEVNGINIGVNTKQNNNIAWRNVSVYDIISGDDEPQNPTGVFIRGVDRESEMVNLQFIDRGFGEVDIEVPFFEVGRVKMQIPRMLYDRMVENGSLETEGVEIIDENGRSVELIISSSEVVLRNIPLRYEESFVIGFNFEIPEREMTELLERRVRQLRFDFVQKNSRNNQLEGGELFLINLKKEKDKKISNSLEEKEMIHVSPNPSNEEFHVYFEELVKGKIQVSDINGNVILQKSSINGKKEMIINISKWPKGIYILECINEGKKYTKKLIKN